MEKIIENKTCKQCQCTFDITDRDLEFYDKVSPSFGWKKYEIPTPTLCPDCRQQRRLSFRNERKLYKRECDASGKPMISIYSPDKKYKVYDSRFWWSDNWDPLSSGIDYNSEISFFQQFDILLSNTPLWWIIVVNDVQESPFTNYTAASIRVYMSVDIFESEDIYHCTTIKRCKNLLDCYDLEDSQYVYMWCFSRELYNCKYVSYSKNCKNSSYLYGCENLSFSDFCVWLRDKKYYILNKEYSKEDYEQFWENNDKEDIIKEYEKLLADFPRKSNTNINTEKSLWDNLIHSKNALYCFDSIDTIDSKFVSVWHWMDRCMDTTIHNLECLYDYEAISGWRLVWSAFNVLGWWWKWFFYNFECVDSSNLFGCVWLRNKSYCILNKQYTKEQYEDLVPKIIEKMKKDWEWWEFFPSSMSPFGYNETVANEYFSLTKQEVQEKWFKWSDYEAPFPKVEKIIPASKLPEDITEIPDDILNWAIECEVTKKPFRIIKPELEFYRKHKLPIPKRHPDQRHLDRMSLRNPRKLYERNCDKCSVEIQTTYAPDKSETVYCESCYDNFTY